MLSISNLSFSYNKFRRVITDLNSEIEPGHIYGLLGPNGAGKSTLLYLIAGLLTPDCGTVEFDGYETRQRLPQTLSDIFIVPEVLTLPAVTLDTFIKMNAPFYPRFSAKDLRRHLETFGVADFSDVKLTSLSMGQQKKVYMSFALACNTSLLLMDEPTNGLDIPGKVAFRRFITSGTTEHQSIIISTHQVRDVDHIIDHVLIMDEHSLIYDKSIFEISKEYAFLVTSDANLIAQALVAQPTIGGVQIALHNDGSYDTEVDLETLFILATNNANKL